MIIVWKAGLKTTDLFSAHFDMPPSSVQAQGHIVNVLGSGMGMLEGVVMNEASVPADVPHFDVIILSEVNRRSSETLLAPWTYTVRITRLAELHSRGGKRENSFKYMNFARVPKYLDLKLADEENNMALQE